MLNTLPVKIKRENNSIKEASITFFLANTIENPNRFKEIADDNNLKGFFHLFQNVGEFSLKVAPNDPNGITKIQPDTGFRLIRKENELTTFVVQGINQRDRIFISFHSYNYERWQGFINCFNRILEAINRIQNEIIIAGVSLSFVDEFIWDESQAFDLSRIMLPQEYLPHNFIKIQGGHLSNTREIRTIQNHKLFDRLEVLVNSTIGKVLTIAHNQTALVNENGFNYKDLQSKEVLSSLLEELHVNNKRLLDEILLPEVKELIKLNKD